MATSVFPKTDDTVTVSGWAAMIAALDRGQEDPFSGVGDVDNDSTNLVWSGSDSGFTLSSTGFQTFATLPVDEGSVWAGEVNIEIERVDNGGSAGDGIVYAITVPDGITAYALVLCHENLGTANGTVAGGVYTNVTDENIASTAGGITSANVNTRIILVIKGNAASGDVLIRMEKQTDTDADDWNIFGRAMLTRIKG